MLEAIIKGVFWLLTKLSSILLFPFVALFDGLFPDASHFVEEIELWLDSNIWQLVGFVKQVMINFGVPQLAFTFVIGYYTAIMLLWSGSKLYLFGYNVYRHFKP